MENKTSIVTSSSSPSSSSPPTPPPPPPPPVVIISPCAACRILRRRCVEKCVLAPYFPPSEPHKFTTAHRVFGASNIIKFLQDLPESQREDAVSSIVYEANARIRDPVYGCAGAICQLQKQVNELQTQLAKAQAKVVTLQCQQANLAALIYMEMAQSSSPTPSSNSMEDHLIIDSTTPTNNYLNEPITFIDDTNNQCSLWDPLWT